MNGSLARRYAAALADVAIERNEGEAIKAGLASFVDAFFASADLRNFLESPGVEAETKRAVIEKLAERMNLDAAVRNFIWIIADHRRTEMLREIEAAFRDELNGRLGVAEAEVMTARLLDDREKRELTAALERRTGKRIEATFRENRDLLGGAIVRVGSTIYDGSVREQLARLRAELEAE